MKKLLSILIFALIGHFSYSQNYTPQESNKRSIYLMPVRVDSVASSAYKRVITRYLNGAYGTVVSASTYTSNGEERIMVSRTSNTTITLGSKDCVQGKEIIIQDLAGARSSGNYIQVGSSSGNVSGSSYLRIITGNDYLTLYFDGTNWKKKNGSSGDYVINGVNPSDINIRNSANTSKITMKSDGVSDFINTSEVNLGIINDGFPTLQLYSYYSILRGYTQTDSLAIGNGALQFANNWGAPYPEVNDIGNSGKMWYNSIDGKLRFNEGGVWKDVITTGGATTSVTASSPLSSSGGVTPNISIANAAADGSTKGAASFADADFNASSGNISIDYTNGQTADGSTKGFLSSANWTTFNNKEPAITIGTTGQYWRGDKTFQTLDKTAVGLSNVENTALSTWAGSTNLTTVGTIGTGTWNGTTIGVANGGTGATSFTAGRVLFGNGTSAIGSSANLTFDGSKFSVAGGADAFLVTSTGSGVTSQLEQTSNNDVLHRFKRNGGNYWDARYYYTGESFRFRYNDADKVTLGTDGSVTATGALSAASASLITPLTVGNGGTGRTSVTTQRLLYGNGTSALGADDALKWVTGANQLKVNGTIDTDGYAGAVIRSYAGTAMVMASTTTDNSGIGGALFNNAGSGTINNVAMGYYALGGLTTSSVGNIGIGYYSLSSLTASKTGNIGIGGYAGQHNTGNDNIFIGRQAAQASTGVSNAIVIGANTGSNVTSNSVLIGNASNHVYFPNSVTIGEGVSTFTTPSGYSFKSKGNGIITGTLSVNGLAAGATSDTAVVVNAGVFKKVKMPSVSITTAGSASDSLVVINAGVLKKVPLTSALTTTGVTAGAFGSASAAPIITVGTDGRITSISTVSITASTTVSLYVRPETHGAVGNGSTDDATAFQTAINTCTSGCVILLSSSKNYRINTMLTVLDNMIFMSDGGAATITSGISGVAHTFYVNNKDNVHFRDINFTLSGSPSNTNVAGHILFNRSKYSSVRNCTFTKSHWFDIQIKGEASENSENIIIDGNKSLQLAAEGGSGNSPCSITVWGYARNITITNNQSLGVGAMGIAIQNFGGTGTINYVYVAGNTIRSKDTYGIMAYDANADRSVVDIQIVNNHVEDINGVNGVTGNAGAGIYLASCFDCLVQGNYVKNSNFGTTGNSLAPGGIGINDADNCIISDNKIVECDYHAITVRNTDGFTLTGNNIMAPRYMAIEVWQSSNGTITGNRMSSASNTEQMYYVKGSSDIVFSGNIVNCTGNYRVVDLDGSGANNRLTISNNNFNYTGTSNVLMFGSSGTNDYVTVKGNIFRNNTSNGTKRGFSITAMTNSDIEGNSFICASGQDAVLTSGTCTGTTYQNNKVVGNVSIDTGTAGLVFTLWGTAAPTAAGYAVGSRVFNSAPSGSGSAYGWIYTSGGTWRTISTL